MQTYNTKLLSSFSVFGLHGDRDIRIEFDSNTTIMVASNGAGKTSIINILYHFLNQNLHRLSQYDFEEIEAVFENGTTIKIHPSDLEAVLPDFSGHDLPTSAKRIIERITSDQLLRLIEVYRQDSNFERVRGNKDFTDTRISLRIPSSELHRALGVVDKVSRLGSLTSGPSSDWPNLIKKHFPCNLLFLPTYRRVEEDLTNLGLSIEDGQARLSTINFGMSDVRRRFDSIMRSISESSLIFYQQMSGRMLDELMNGLNADTLDYQHISRPEIVAPLLKRFASSISTKTQQEILQLTISGGIREHRYRPLAYFISRLVEIDKERQEAESYVIRFCEVVNSYFEDKEIVYNNEAMTITVVNKRSIKPIELDKLSSGEKQLISLFSQIYLGTSSDLAVLFDEPELSLSMDWQQKVLIDIIQSGRCKFLLAATHSPFIFDNGLESNVQPMYVNQREIFE